MYIKVRVYEEEGELRGFVQAKALGPLQSSHLEWASPTWTSSPNDAWTQVISKRPYSFSGHIRCRLSPLQTLMDWTFWGLGSI